MIIRNDQTVEALATDFILRGESLAVSVVDSFLGLPGLRGFWPMSVFDSSGNALDVSPNARTLTYNGNPTYNYSGFAPYIAFDGTGDYLSRTDEAGLDIIGTESYVTAAFRGLTMGGWFYPTSTAVSFMMCKADNTTGPYLLRISGTPQAIFVVRDSTDTTSYQTGVSISANAWQFIVGRYDPSTEIKIWNNTETNTNTTSIPASLLNGADGFGIGATGAGTTLFTGRASLCFLSTMYLSDAIINNLFQQSRGLFGV